MAALPLVKNILVLDSEGKRVAVKYYTDDWPLLSSKLAFEKSVFTKTVKINARNEADIVMFDGHIVVFKFIQDLHFFVTGGDDENELILASVLQGFFDAVGTILRPSGWYLIFEVHCCYENEKVTWYQGSVPEWHVTIGNNVDKRTALENLDLIYLCLDEVVDGGMILETDASVIADKVSSASGLDSGAPFSEQTLSQAFAVAREHFARSLLK